MVKPEICLIASLTLLCAGGCSTTGVSNTMRGDDTVVTRARDFVSSTPDRARAGTAWVVEQMPTGVIWLGAQAESGALRAWEETGVRAWKIGKFAVGADPRNPVRLYLRTRRLLDERYPSRVHDKPYNYTYGHMHAVNHYVISQVSPGGRVTSLVVGFGEEGVDIVTALVSGHPTQLFTAGQSCDIQANIAWWGDEPIPECEKAKEDPTDENIEEAIAKCIKAAGVNGFPRDYESRPSWMHGLRYIHPLSLGVWRPLGIGEGVDWPASPRSQERGKEEAYPGYFLNSRAGTLLREPIFKANSDLHQQPSKPWFAEN